MTLILIIAIIWGASALARMSKPSPAPVAVNRKSDDELLRMHNEWKKQKAEAEAEAIRQVAILAEEKRQEQEEKLKRRIADADGEIEYQRQQIERLRQHMEHSEIERDACVYGSTRYFQWDKKCMALEHQIHAAEARLSKAKDTKFFCEDKLAS